MDVIKRMRSERDATENFFTLEFKVSFFKRRFKELTAQKPD
jgi:hypothetical protein